MLNLVKHHLGRVRSGSGSCCHPRGAPTTGSETFDELVDEGNDAPVDTWDFGWLDGRATEERPSWRYFDRVAERAGAASSLLELQAGTGSMIGRLPERPPLAVATEGYPPSVAAAAPRLRRRGVHLVVTSQTQQALPLKSDTFELAISRHPVEVWWREIARVLRPGGRYFAQHVGPDSLRDLSEFLMGPQLNESRRDPSIERRAAQRAGLEVREIRVERTRVAFADIGAVVYFLRLVPWIVPGFVVSAYEERLRALHTLIERHGAFETTSSRMLVDAVKP
ncbi:MAG TPA: methyltransferase domain-containing protein [Acidimicrobiales bacterium]|nr:methyltransferase domain-containing protein [Acidimicrobiales bacterium]